MTTPAAPTLRTALHGATRELSAITPGMILSLLGTSMGPVTGVNGNVSGAGAFETSYNGYRVLFDGVPAPILYISSTQIDTVAPYAIAGRQSTRVEVEYNGARSNPSELIVSPDAAPGIYTVDGSGRGQAAAINQSGRSNGPANPASADSVLVFYVTGEGTEPVGQEGRVIATDLREAGAAGVCPYWRRGGGGAVCGVDAGAGDRVDAGERAVEQRGAARAGRAD